MNSHEDLIRRLESICPDSREDMAVPMDAATAIKELVAERNRWKENFAKVQERERIEWARAEKAEEIADLSSGVIHKLKTEIAHCRMEIEALCGGDYDKLKADLAAARAALRKSLEYLGLLHQFMCDAHKCDFNEDRTTSWIAYMDYDVRKFSHDEKTIAAARAEGGE